MSYLSDMHIQRGTVFDVRRCSDLITLMDADKLAQNMYQKTETGRLFSYIKERPPALCLEWTQPPVNIFSAQCHYAIWSAFGDNYIHIQGSGPRSSLGIAYSLLHLCCNCEYELPPCKAIN
jgi:hypothetical protein